MSSHVMRWLEHVHLRSSDEPSERAPRVSSRRPSGTVLQVDGAQCYVNVSRRPAWAPGAACSRYHEKDRDGQPRPGVEILRDDDIEHWRGERFSIIISPAERDVDLVQLADRVLEQLEARHGALQGAMWLHHAQDASGRDHLHIAVNSNGGRVVLTQGGVEKAVTRALKVMARDRARSVSR